MSNFLVFRHRLEVRDSPLPCCQNSKLSHVIGQSVIILSSYWPVTDSGVSAVSLLSILRPGLGGHRQLPGKKRHGKVIKKGRGVFAYYSVSADNVYLIFRIFVIDNIYLTFKIKSITLTRLID